jgi:putative transposase
MNPVRAGIVDHPGDYPWSSYRANVHGQSNDLLTCHRFYASLGQTSEERQTAYQALFNHGLDTEVIDKIRKATNGNFSLGTSRFQSGIAEALGRRVVPGKAGRPLKKVI